MCDRELVLYHVEWVLYGADVLLYDVEPVMWDVELTRCHVDEYRLAFLLLKGDDCGGCRCGGELYFVGKLFQMREISNLDIKVQLTNEYLRTGGVDKIYDVGLLEDLINIKFKQDGKADAETISARANAFMLALLQSHSSAPIHIDNQIAEYASFIQKGLFFDQYKIETKEQVDELFEKFKTSKDILFRGQREAKWRLYSSLQRFWVWDQMSENEDYTTFLKQIIESGSGEFDDQIKQVLKGVNIDSINDISVLGYLQHHNCPTPLLDWTYSFSTAMFFGIDELEVYESAREIDKYFSVYFIEEEHFDNEGMRSLISEVLQTLSDQLKQGLITQIAKDKTQEGEMEAHFRERSFFDKSKLLGSGLINHITKIEHMINIPLTFFSDKDVESGIAFSLTNSDN